jgi:putative ABC transport system permease protein
MMYAIRSAFRSLSTQRGSALLALLCLGVGIGTNTTVFSIVNGLLLRELPLREPDRLVMVQERSRQAPDNAKPLTYAAFQHLAQPITDVMDIAAERGLGLRISDGDASPERESGAFVSANLFHVLGIHPQLGRTFVEQDERAAASPVALVSYALWQQRYAADPAILGKTIVVNGTAVRVVGVMPQTMAHPALRGFAGARLFLPLGQMDARIREQTPLRVIGRIRDGVTIAAAQSRVDAIPPLPATADQITWSVEPLRLGFSPSTQATIALLMCAVGFVLLMACVNVANLTLARTAARGHELATRLALGATRRQLILQLVVESLVVALASVPAGMLLASWGRTLLLGPSASPEIYEATSIDTTVVMFSIGLALLASVLSGLLPAAHAVRRLQVDLLRAAGRTDVATGPRHSVLSRVLIGVQVSLAMILLVSSAVFFKSFRTTLRAEGGFETSRILSIALETAEDGAQPDDRSLQRLFAVLDRVIGVPSIEHAAAATFLPLRDAGVRTGVELSAARPGTPPTILIGGITADFFRVLGVPIVQGRGLTDAEARSLAPVAVINRRMAQRLWANQNPIGQRFRPIDSETWFTVVGVSESILNWDISDRPQPTAYVSIPHVPDREPRVFLRTAGDPLLAAQPARAAIHEASPDTPVLGVLTMTEVHYMALSRHQTLGRLFAVLGAIALMLGAAGVYGVLSYFVTNRTVEIGIRAALGADARSLVRMFVTQGMTVTAIGLAVGLPAAWAVARLLRGRLYNVSPPDLWIFAGVTILLAAVALAAAWLPSRRAASVDPLIALKG